MCLMQAGWSLCFSLEVSHEQVLVWRCGGEKSLVSYAIRFPSRCSFLKIDGGNPVWLALNVQAIPASMFFMLTILACLTSICLGQKVSLV